MPVSKVEEPSGARIQPGPPGRELRRFIRFRIDDATVFLSRKGILSSIGLRKAEEAGWAVNFCEGGALLRSHRPLSTGTKVIVRIELEKYSDSIESTGEVRWCAPSARNAQEYYTGIQFVGLGAAEIKKIGHMREWFNSPEYRTRIALRGRLETPAISPR